jgi:2-oxoglutarate dehydrogenase E2 component (dihydrolipoamide succinyltransferase)
MTHPIIVPSFGESITEATVGRFLKPSGALVQADEEIVELETDKVNQPLYAPASGTLSWSVKEGDAVSVGQTIGQIASGAGAPAPTPPAVQTPAPPRAAPPVAPKAVEPPPAPPRQASRSADAPRPPARPGAQETRQKLSKLRQVIAQRLVEVKNQTAMLTTFNEVDMSALIAFRQQEQEAFQKTHGIKLGFMPFFVKAVAAALAEYPAINARIEGDEIVFSHNYDIGIAVSTDRGLMVPVVRNADRLTLAEIEKQIKTFADKARQGTIAISDLEGGTFTITNGGVFGSLLSTPILNPPQSGILGMHAIVKRPVAVGDEIAIRPMMYLALSYDHRIVDGKESIGFLVHIKQTLEDPTPLLYRT